jgi:hypothetical protein
MRSAVDLVMADQRRAALPLLWEPGTPHVRGPAYTTDTPVKRMTLDAFVRRDVFPGVSPGMWIYDTAARGNIRRCEDPTREHDRLHMQESIRELPAGLASARLSHVPRYVEMLEYLYGTLGWDPSHFRGYRLEVQYPVYGAQYMIGFRIPEKPGSA